MALLGWVLVALGILAIFAGIVGGIVAMIKDLKRRSLRPTDLPTEFLKVLTEFLKALIGARSGWH
jgi:hypothetical protein